MALSSSRNPRAVTRFFVLYAVCMIFSTAVFCGTLTLLSDTYGVADTIATPISSLIALTTSAGFYALVRPPAYTLLAGSFLLSAMQAWSFHIIGLFHSRWNLTLTKDPYLVWPDEPPTVGTMVLSFGIAFVVVHIVIALAIQPINDTDDMKEFQMVTRYFQSVAFGTRQLGLGLCDTMKTFVTDFGLALRTAMTMHLSQDEGFVQDVALLPTEVPVEVGILISSAAVREL